MTQKREAKRQHFLRRKRHSRGHALFRAALEKDVEMIAELDEIILDCDLPGHALTRGDLGIVVLVHNQGEGYEVEFMTLDGETIAVVTPDSAQVRPIGHNEIAHARGLFQPA